MDIPTCPNRVWAPLGRSCSKMDNRIDLIDLTAEIVSAYLGNHIVKTSDLAALILRIHGALNDLARDGNSSGNSRQKPAIDPKRSVLPDAIVCLEDGLRFKSLKRHLRTSYDMSPDEYRRKWGLPAGYPMVAPNYAKQRSALAKKIGLGRKTKARR